ncbi:MAG: hypothetical protein J5804_02000 [Eggerthellaceae bacterium]|nr:hypothetical protein [Eggerthellaceae bacterium]
MKLGDLNLDEIYEEGSGKSAQGASRVAKVMELYSQVSSEEGKSPETVAAIRSLKKLVPGAIAVSVVAITLVLLAGIYTIWMAYHGANAGFGLVIGAAIAAAVLLGGFFALAKRTFGKDWYAYRDSLGL